MVKKNKPDRPKYRVTVFSAFLFALIADQVSKYVASIYGTISINPGISFGLVPGIFLTFALVVFFIMFYEWSCPRWQKPYPILTGLLLGGAMSNIVDRLVLSGVRDFLPLPFVGIQNNLADWFIVVSLVIITLREII
jgi:lipoprotein signal peptidase